MERALTEQEISVLTKNGCLADDWKNVRICDGFKPERVTATRFRGKVVLGNNSGSLKVNGVDYPCGIHQALLIDTVVQDNVVIQNVGSHISNYILEAGCAVLNVAELTAQADTSFGLGTGVECLNEAGGREVPLATSLSSQMAYILTIYRYRPKAVAALSKLLQNEVMLVKGKPGRVGKGAIIAHCGPIVNVLVGPFAKIEGALALSNGAIESCQEDPAVIGSGVKAEHFIILSGAHVTSQAMLSKVLVGEGARIGKQFSAENSLFFANAEGFHGEACAIFAGPYAVTHHKSTLLIAALYSFYNAGSGTNHSNHMYKLGPVHQGILERGCKTGSFSYLLLESHLAPFCVVIGKHMTNMDLPDFPFSYLSESGGKSYLTPAMNLLTVGTVRDQEKWASRDRRKVPLKKDIINPAVYSPYTVQKMVRGRDKLLSLYESTPKDVESVNIGGVNLSRLLMKNSAKYYAMTILRFAYQNVFVRLEEKLKSGLTLREALKAIKPTLAAETEWVDLCGLLCTKKAADALLTDLENDRFGSVEEVQLALSKIHATYAEAEWAYACSLFEKEKGMALENLTKEVAVAMIDDWMTLTRKMSNMIFADAEKEFEDFARIGFGLSGSGDDAKADFEVVRGDKETNKVLVKMKKEYAAFVAGAEALKQSIQQSR
ncbi:MAG: hypothetical protein A2293_09605 [Elusimicrobia bacterium RIFOXYB2_FULL_49_7]|nr:MAG: hypothetical protein A2293_09605 [Elusimicrobia bacterium RIFOXYB2_FULL_49_7]